MSVIIGTSANVICVRTFAYVLLTYVLYILRKFAYELLRTNICIRTPAYERLQYVFCRTYFILYIHLVTNICIRTFDIRTLHFTYFCKRTLAYEFSHTYFCRAYFIPIRTFAYELSRTNICMHTFDTRTLYPTYICCTFAYELLHTYFWHRYLRTLHRTYFCKCTFAYVLLPYVVYPLRIFAYEHSRTYFCSTYLAIRTSVLQSLPQMTASPAVSCDFHQRSDESSQLRALEAAQFEASGAAAGVRRLECGTAPWPGR